MQQYTAAGMPADEASCDSIAAVMAARLSEATWQPYSSMFGQFVRFCIDMDVDFLPATNLLACCGLSIWLTEALSRLLLPSPTLLWSTLCTTCWAMTALAWTTHC